MVKQDTILQCKQKNQLAFKAMYEACLPYVFSIVKTYTNNPDSRKDLVQEIFAKLFLNIGSFDPDRGEFKPWLRKIAANQCLMFLRDKKRGFEFDDLEDSTAVSGLQESLDLRQLDPDASEVLLAKMPDGYRRVFSMVVFEGYSHDEVGQTLGITAETSRSQLARSKQWLRQYFTNNKTLMENEYF